MELWDKCSAHFKGAPVPENVPPELLETLRDIYKSGDLWKGEGLRGTREERMIAFKTTERVELILNTILSANPPTT